MANATQAATSSAPAIGISRGLSTWAVWVAQVGAAAIFLMAGISKLSGAAAMVQLFDAIGLGQWFRYVTGAIEVGGAVLLLIPSLAFFGALALIPTMIGALLTHLFLGGSPVMAAVLLAAVSYVAWVRRPTR